MQDQGCKDESTCCRRCEDSDKPRIWYHPSKRPAALSGQFSRPLSSAVRQCPEDIYVLDSGRFQ